MLTLNDEFLVLAQGFTVLVMCIGGFYSIKPHDRPKTMQEKMDRHQAS